MFGLNQKLDDLYGAVIPKFIHSAKYNKSPIIYGDGKNSRDFTYIENVIQANILAILSTTINKHEIFLCLSRRAMDTDSKESGPSMQTSLRRSKESQEKV